MRSQTLVTSYISFFFCSYLSSICSKSLRASSSCCLLISSLTAKFFDASQLWSISELLSFSFSASSSAHLSFAISSSFYWTIFLSASSSALTCAFSSARASFYSLSDAKSTCSCAWLAQRDVFLSVRVLISALSYSFSSSTIMLIARSGRSSIFISERIVFFLAISPRSQAL